MFGGLGNIGDLLKGIDFNNIDIGSIAGKLIHLIPDGKGKQAMDIGVNIARNGGSPRDVKKALEDFIPGASEKLNGNQAPALLRQIWANIPDDKDAVVAYGQNVVKQFNLLKNNGKGQ